LIFEFISKKKNRFKFLPSQYNRTNFHLRSTDVPRTLKSLEFLMKGLYPSISEKVSAAEVPVLEINTIDQGVDNAFPNTNLCPLLRHEIDLRRRDPEYQSFHTNTVLPLINKVASLYNISAGSVDIGGTSDILFCRLCHQKPLMQGFTQQLANEILNADNFLNNYSVSTTRIISLIFSSFFQEWVEAFEASISGSPIKMYLYSAHDSSVRPFVMALGAYDGFWPPYASHLTMELYKSKSTGQFFVTSQYNGKLIKMTGCPSEELCPFYTVKQLFSSFQIPNYEQECHRSP
jgi:hypothetical protein